MIDRIESILQDMEDPQVIMFSHHANDPNVGLSLHEDSDRYKLFLSDTGLFITLAFWDKDVTENVIYQKLLSDKLSAYLDMCMKIHYSSPDSILSAAASIASSTSSNFLPSTNIKYSSSERRSLMSKS